MFKKKDECKIISSIEEIFQMACPILNREEDSFGLEILVKFVDNEPFQIICPAYCKIKIDTDIDDLYESYNCELKKENESQSCIYSNWKRL